MGDEANSSGVTPTERGADASVDHAWATRVLDAVPDNIQCSVCGNTEWGVSSTIFELVEYRRGLRGPGSALTFIVVTCTKCAHSILFNAVQLGLVDPKTGEVLRD